MWKVGKIATECLEKCGGCNEITNGKEKFLSHHFTVLSRPSSCLEA
jgi:hypothetical protein